MEWEMVVKNLTMEWKMVSKKKLSKKWKEYIINYDAQPGKNPTLFKAHKPDIPVRLLTTGC